MWKAKRYTHQEVSDLKTTWYKKGLKDGAESVRSALREILQLDRITEEILDRAKLKYGK
jgi:hypothetical protein